MLETDQITPGALPATRGRTAPSLPLLIAAATLVGLVGCSSDSKGDNGDPGTPGSATGGAVVAVVDAANHAVVGGARVVADPGGQTVTTDGAGVATFTGLAAGLYKFTASAPSLLLSGDTVVTGADVEADTGDLSIVAGVTAAAKVELKRIDTGAANLAALHAGSTGFSDANCKACHGDRKGEVSRDPARKPFHAMATHSSMSCTLCHIKVDTLGDSGAALRKQVSATICKGCHPSYPASF